MAGPTTLLPALPPPLAPVSSRLHRLRRLLGWGFGVSVALHVLLAPLVANYKAPVADTEQVSMVTLSRHVTIQLPSPTPAPTPRPTKPRPRPSATPERTAAPVAVHQAPQAHLRVNVFKTTTRASASSNDAYRARPGTEAGVPQGTLASAPPAAAVGGPPQAGSSASASTTTPVITRTAPPACAQPNAQAKINTMAELVYPDFVGEGGEAKVGEVDVLVSLSAAGAVTATSIYSSSGNRKLDFAAIRAARATTYLPQLAACLPVAGVYLFHASFALR